MEPATPGQPAQTSVGLYLALLQLFFTLTWTIYVIFLPKFAAQVGIRPQMVIVILMLDQAIFAFMDWLMGRLSDRWALVIGRLSRIVAVTTAVSCVAFLLLPFVAPTGSEALFLALTILRSASSSVLRAPPLALLGKYASRNSVPWLASLSMVGLGVAGALAPYLTVTFRDADPRLPFVLASVGLLFVSFGLGWAERNLADAPPLSEGATPSTSSNVASRSPLALFLVAITLLGLGFQIHFSMNTAPLFLKFAKPPELEQLMPVFWIGFSLLMLPTTFLTKRYGGLSIMAAGGVIGAQAAFIALHAGNLSVLTAAQFVAGGAWGCVMMSAVTAALALGKSSDGDSKTGNEGSITGALFSLLAIATFVRMAIIWAEINKDPTFATIQPWLPVAAWMLAAGLLLAIALRRGEGGALQRV